MQYDDSGFYAGGDDFGFGDTTDFLSSPDLGGFGSQDITPFYGPAATGDPMQDIISAGGTPGPSGYAPGVQAPPAAGGLGGTGFGLPGILGLLGGGAGLLGTLLGGGVTGGTRPQQGVPARAAGNQAYAGFQGLQPFAQGQTPLQQQQAGLINQIAGGQIPPGLARLVANAYDPLYQQAYTRSAQAGQRAGFYDQPAFSPPGGAIMGPAAAQLQGQQANTLLGLLTQLPSLYNQPIAQQYQAAQGGAQGFGNLMGQYPVGQQATVPQGPQIAGQLGNIFQGAGQAIQQGQQQAQAGQTQNLLNQYLQKQISLSNQPGAYNFQQYPTG